MRYKISHKSKLFNKYLISYLAIVILSLFIGAVSYYMSVKIIEVEITKAHQKSLNQVKNASDNIIKELEMLYIQIAFDETTQMLMSINKVEEPQQMLEMDKIEKDIKRYQLSYPVIQDAYLYFGRSENVLSSYGRHKMDTFLESSSKYGDEIFKYDPEIFERWTIDDYTGIDIFSTEAEDGKTKNMVAYIKGLPVGKKDNYLGKLIVIIDDGLINEEMNKFEWIEQGTRFVINEDDQIFLTNTDSDFEFSDTYESLRNDTVIDSYDDMVLSCVKSDLLDWKYVYIIPKNIFFEKAETVKNIIIFSVLFVLCVGFFLSYSFASKYYEPIDKLVMFIQNNLEELKKQDEDEYNFIKKIISNTLREKQVYQENIKKFSARLKNEFLMRLFRGELNNSAIEHMKSIHDVDINDNTKYLMIMVYLDDISLLSADGYSDEGTKENLGIARLILINMLDELMQGKYSSINTEEDDLIIYLIDVDGMEPKEAFDDVKAISNKFLDIVKNKFKISIFAALSNIYEGYDGIKQAFAEANSGIEYFLLIGREQEGFTNPANSEKPDKISRGFRKDIERFAQSILAKDFRNSKIQLNDIFENWLTSGKPTTNILKYRMSELTNTYMNSVEDLKMLYKKNSFDSMETMDALFNCKNIEELQSKLNKMLDSFASYIVDMDKTEPDLVQKSVKYINENYHDCNLNISSIADHMDINVPYYSKQFKKSTGIGPLEYLQLKRIEEAKRLLKQSSESIKDISKKVGFAYEVSFIRVFKKFEGVTPGTYRS